MNRQSLLVGAAALPLLLAACSSSSKPGHASKPSAGGVGNIVISGYTYSGGTTVKPGEKVTITNKDDVAHTLTQVPKKLFDTGSIGGGKTVTFTAPTKPGSYTFGCTFHRNMAGTLIVTG